jgi:anti-anti-sigma regulatory factor
LRITIQENENVVEITLEGRIAGPWVAELTRFWLTTETQLGSRKLTLDLRNVTYADAPGKRVLTGIVTHTHPKLVTSTPWTQYLAEEITQGTGPNTKEEAGYGNHA